MSRKTEERFIKKFLHRRKCKFSLLSRNTGYFSRSLLLKAPLSLLTENHEFLFKTFGH